MKPKIIVLVALLLLGAGHVAIAADTAQQENGVACELIVPTPLVYRESLLEIRLVIKNVSAAPIRVCTLCGRWSGISKDCSEVSLVAGFFKSDGPSMERLAQAVLSIPPGDSITLPSECVIPEANPFRLTAGYSIHPNLAKQLNTWQGGIRAEPVMINIKSGSVK